MATDARITQEPVEVLYKTDPDARVSQEPVEVLYPSATGFAAVTQLPVEVLYSYISNQPIRITQVAAEEALQYGAVPARITQVAVEDAIKYGSVPARISQIAVEAPFKYGTTILPVRVSQVAIELLRTEGCYNPVVPDRPTFPEPIPVPPENVCQGRRMLVSPEIRTFKSQQATSRRGLVMPEIRIFTVPGEYRNNIVSPLLG